MDLYLKQDSRSYKLEVLFEDIRECFGCHLDGTGAILLQVSSLDRAIRFDAQSSKTLMRPYMN